MKTFELPKPVELRVDTANCYFCRLYTFSCPLGISDGTSSPGPSCPMYSESNVSKKFKVTLTEVED